ncbi:MAG: hypothetical protein RI897_4188 [Verrucomicrobiota bacterium]
MRLALPILILLANLSVLASTQDPTPPAPPNIVLILADDMGFSDLGCYGSEIHTPNLDRLAREGMRFTEFHNTSKCFPSRACLLTGVYAQQCGMDRKGAVIQNAITLGEALQPAGYTTLWSGKHHGTENPYNRGFHHYAGLRDGACNHFNPGLPRPKEPPPAQKSSYGKRTFCFDAQTIQPFTPTNGFYTTDAFTDWALQWLDEIHSNQNQKPFFLYLAYTAPHDPLMAWPDDIAKYATTYNAGYQQIREQRYQKQIQLGLLNPTTAPLSPQEAPNWNSLPPDTRTTEIQRMQVYAAMIDRLDQNVGRLLQKLQSIQRLENTLILFASDNGASSESVEIGSGEIGTVGRWTSQLGDWANVSNTPYRKYKNFSLQGGIKTPLIAWWPNHIQPNTINDAPGHFIDVMPTLIEIAGASYPKPSPPQTLTPLQGVSLLPALHGKPLNRPTPIFWQWAKGRAIRHQNWKLVSQTGDQPSWELYNLDADRTELHNLASQYPDKVQSLSAKWRTWYQEATQTQR